MICKASCFVLVAITALLTWEAPAWAGDPSQIGKHLEEIVTPNVKSFWKIGMLVGVVVIVFGRMRSSLVVAILVGIVVSGMIIYNPGGVSSMVSDMGKKVL